MDKMREEFEAWAINCDLCTFAVGDEYKYMTTEWAWRAWEASRAALCVELPKITDFAKDSRGAREVLNFEFAVECVARELNDVGVRYE